MTEQLLKKGFQGTVYRYLSSGAGIFFSFIISVYLIRRLSIEDYGVYNFLLSVLALAELLGSFGLLQVVQRYLPEYRKSGETYIQKRIVEMAMLMRFFAGLAVIFILLTAGDRIAHFFNIPDHANSLFPILSFIILFYLQSQILGEAVLGALLENRYLSLAKIVYMALKFMLFYFAISSGYGVRGIIWAWLSVELVLFLIYLIKVRRVIFSVRMDRKFRFGSPFKKMLKFGGSFYFQGFSYFMINKTGDIFILAYFLGPDAVGLYSFVFGLPLMIMRLAPPSLLRPLLVPLVITKYAGTDNKEDLERYFLFINRLTFFIMMPVFLFLMIISDKAIIYLFNPLYITGQGLFILSLAFMMVYQFVYSYSAILYLLEKNKLIIFSGLIALLNLLGDILLIPVYGVLGAILATGTIGLLLLAYYHFSIRKTVRLRYPWVSFGRFGINALFAGAAIFTMRNFISDIFSLICVLLGGLFIYIAASYFNKGFDERDRSVMNRAIGKEIWVF